MADKRRMVVYTFFFHDGSDKVRAVGTVSVAEDGSYKINFNCFAPTTAAAKSLLGQIEQLISGEASGAVVCSDAERGFDAAQRWLDQLNEMRGKGG